MKLLASDYDGTLKFGDLINEEDLQALKDWKEAGNLFAIATGRSEGSIFKEAEQFGLPVDYFICNNGGMVFDADHKPLMTTQLDTITAIDLMYAAATLDDVVSYVAHSNGKRHRVVVHPEFEDHRYPNMEPDLSEEEVADLGHYDQIILSMRDEQAAIDMADMINQFFGSQVSAYANRYVVDVVPHNVSKATGVQFVEEFASVPEMDVYCVGDSHNDIAMLEAYFNSAAAGLAPEEVRKSASREVLSIKEYIDSILAES